MSSDNAPKKRVVVHTSEDNPPEKKAKVIKDVNDTSPASASEKIVKWGVEDPSEFRPGMLENLGKDQENFRAFYDESDPRYDTIKKTYTEMHREQTVDSVTKRMSKWCAFNKCKMGMMEAVMLLDKIIDESDPDTSLPNSMHCFQTAERIREKHPDLDWFHLTGLLHDAGKVLAVWGEPQYAVVGDTFPVGCAFSDKCVFPELFDANPDKRDERYNTKYGMYKPNCGLRNVQMSFGHDEYLYQVLMKNGTTLPEEALYCIRYHSFYPWHNGGDYNYLCDQKDKDMLKWINEFNKFDLYSKADDLPEIEDLKEYYQGLIDKYLPSVLCW